MFTRNEGDPSPLIDSITAVEGQFRFHPGIDHVPNIELVMMYLNRATKTSYGTVPLKPNNWSAETLQLFKEFLESAEKDYGQVLFKGGHTTPFGPVPSSSSSQAETGEGIPKTLGGT
jgi:hypothetical protein